VAGAATWIGLASFGMGGVWPSLGVVAGTGLLLAVASVSNSAVKPQRTRQENRGAMPGRHAAPAPAPRHKERAVRRELAADSEGARSAGRPNSVLEDYNTLLRKPQEPVKLRSMPVVPATPVKTAPPVKAGTPVKPIPPVKAGGPVKVASVKVEEHRVLRPMVFPAQPAHLPPVLPVAPRDEEVTPADDSVRLSDDSMRLSDDSMRLSDDSMRLSDDSMRLSDDSVRLSDDSVRLSDDSMRLSDDSVSLSDDSVSFSDDGLSLCDQLVNLYNDGVSIPEEQAGPREAPVTVREEPVTPRYEPVPELPRPVTARVIPLPQRAPAPAPLAPFSEADVEPEPNGYQLPPISMLPVPPARKGASDDEHLERAILLEHTLKTFGVEARVIDFAYGPAVTRYELQPAPGVRVNKFTQLADDIALALAAEDIRIEAPIPGKAAVGIEVPNKVRQTVPLREVLESPQFRNHPSKLTVAFGKDNAGNAVVGDLARMPHLLIAGSTGSGKSVCMNTIICSLLFKAKPDEVKMLMIDPKMVELSTYNGVPHLTAPVITDVRKAAGFLKGAVKEMEGRYELFAAAGVRNIEQYNKLVAADPGPDPEHPRKPLPYIVIFIDELADLMMVAPADVEDAICRLAQMARACGMHLVIATQSPRVDVITGLIKANVPSRIAFAVSSQIDSRVIMDSAGAERLLGRGDMLYHPSGLPKPVRAQGAFIDEVAVDELVKYVKAQAKPTFSAQEVAVDLDKGRGRSNGQAEESAPVSAADAAFPQAVRVVVEHGQASVSILQRRLRCNYSKAARLIDMMEEKGFVGPHQGSRPRDVLVSMAQWQEMFDDMAEEPEESAE
jgi:DNA segregation ATPase FtsK/SpoIIIE, S-DNA-T family